MTSRTAQSLVPPRVSPLTSGSAWSRGALLLIQLWRISARRLWQNNVMAMSAALSFRSIFALVPTLVLSFLMLNSAGALKDSKQQFQTLIYGWLFKHVAVAEEVVGVPPLLAATPESPEHGPPAPMPASGSPGGERTVRSVADEIERIVRMVEEKVTLGKVGPIGVILLAWSAMSLISTIERSLNRIFGARQERSLGRRIIMHWSALTLGPLLLVVAAFGGQKALALSARIEVLSWLLKALGWLGPVIVGVLVLAALYKLLPNTHVSTRGAFIGACVAVPAWMIAKWGFDIYVRELVGTGNLYGTLGLFPLFLIWLNFSWLILLAGAELAHVAANLRRLQAAELAENLVFGPTDLLAAAAAVARPYLASQGPAKISQLETALCLPRESVTWLLDRLRDNDIVCKLDEGEDPRFVLARPADKIPVTQILELQPPADAPPSQNGYTPEIRQVVAALQRQAGASLGQSTLADLLNARSS